MGEPARSAGAGLLAGLTVIECATAAGAQAATLLAGLGARVVKVTRPGAPVEDPVLARRFRRDKEIVELDLRSDPGRERFELLVARSDALIVGLRPGFLASIGLGHGVLRARNTALVVLELTAFGRHGPMRDATGHGTAIDAWAGLLRTRPAADGGVDIDSRLLIGMDAGPLYGAVAVLAALLRARATGRGAHLEVPLAQAALAFDWQARAEPANGGALERLNEGARHRPYATADGELVLLVADTAGDWARVCRAAGVDAGADGDPGVRAALRRMFGSRTAEEWIGLARRDGLPIVRCHTPASREADEHLRSWVEAGAAGGPPVRVLDE